MWENSKNINVAKLNDWKCEKLKKSKSDKGQKTKLWQNLKLKLSKKNLNFF